MALTGHNLNVFINCPFDSRYRRLFRAAVFAVFDCGFVPRCALEENTQLDSKTRLPRFNMPLELGLFLGAHRFGNDRQRKQCLIVDSQKFRYQRFISDISGQDISAHNNDPEIMVYVVRNWLNPLSPRRLPGGTAIWNKFEAFQTQLPKLCLEDDLEVSTLTYDDLTNLISEWLVEESRTTVRGGSTE